MATTRIKDLSKTATTVNSDSNLVLDGNTGGTQKITRDNFRQDTADAFVAAPGTYNLAPINSGTGKIDATYLPTSSDTPKGAWNASTNTPTLADGSGTAGDYYDVTVAGSSDLGSGSITFTVGDVVKYDGTTWFKIDSVTNILDGVSTIDGAKAAIEIPDVGTDPSEVPLNQHLGSMAYQDADSVSVAELQVESTTGTATTQALTVTDGTDTNFVVQEDGRVGIGGSPGNYNVNADDLIVGDGVGSRGLSIATGDSSTGRIIFANASTPASIRGAISYVHGSEEMIFATNAGTRATIDSQGRLGVNQTAPGTFYAGANNLVIGDHSAANQGMTIASGASNYGLIYFSDTFGGTGLYQGSIAYNHNTDTLSLGTAGATQWSINSSGNLVAATGNGIDFGSGSTLSDYEEGEHTTTASPSSSGSITLATTYDGLAYTKIGRSIIVTGQLQVSSVSSPTGSSVIFTLPTSTLNLGDFSGGFGAGAAFRDDSSGTWSPISCAAGEGSNQLFAHIDASTVAANDQFRFSICYQSA